MSRNLFRSLALLVVFISAASSTFSQTNSVEFSTVPKKVPEPPPLPLAKPPVEFFRGLLALSPDAREMSLKDRPPENKSAILRKVREYETMTPDDRELRLRATELRWYLLVLMPMAPTNRAPQLAAISEPMRNLIQDRLVTWDRLSPKAQEAVLKGESSLERVVNILARRFTLPSTNAVKFSPEQIRKFEDDLSRFRELPADQQRLIAQHFNNFFDFKPEEKTKVLRVLSDSERKEMEKSLKLFSNLPKKQREKCVSAFKKLATFSPEERRQFLHNAERWQAMSPAERQAWRDLVHKLPPPSPPGFDSSSSPSPTDSPVVSTN